MSCRASAPESPPLTTKSWPTIRAASRKTSRLRGRNLRRLRRPNSKTAAQSSAAKSPPPQRTWSASLARPAARSAWKMSRCVLVTCSPSPMIFSPLRTWSRTSFTCARASQPRGQIAELLPPDAVDVLARPLQVLDAIDVAHHLLGARTPSAQRADHDAAFPVGGEKSALLHHETRPGKSGKPQRGALDRRVEPGARQLEVGIVVEHRLQRFPELVALGEQETRALRVEPAIGLKPRRPGRVLLPPDRHRLAAAGEGIRDAPLQRLRGSSVEVVHRPGRPRRFLALGRRGVGIRDVVIAVRFQRAGKERPERLVAGDR